MGDSDWKRYNDAVDKARAWDAVQKARDQGRDWYQIAKVIRAGERTPQDTKND
jgi:hypothetical protein